MMAKNVDQAYIDMYLDILNLRFDMGRADIAQNLHSMWKTAIGGTHVQSLTMSMLSSVLLPLRASQSAE